MSEPHSNGKDPVNLLRAEEATVTAILQSKMAAQEVLREADRQLVAYRIAEIMVASKELYTKELPRVVSESEADSDTDLFSELAGLRMAFLHVRDLITDFDEAFMVAMSHQREDDGEDADADEDENEEEEES